MLLCISGGFLSRLEYSSEHGKQHQDQDYIIDFRYYIDFNCITVVLNV